jgi:NADH-quinone oxidoreductase subunit H
MSQLLMQSLAVQWFDRNDPFNIILRVLLLVAPLLILVPGFIWWERRLLSWMQDRIGPNRVGTLPKNAKWLPGFLRGRSFWGLLQPIADGVKLFFKEDITPSAVDRVIYFLAPAVALFPAFALGATIPFAGTEGPYRHLTPVADVPIGILYLFAISSLGVYGVVLAGYASNNKYSLMGGLRSSAQLISYELAMGMSLGTIALLSGTLTMTGMVKAQEGPLWNIPGAPFQNWFFFTPFGFVAGVIFAICMIAETNRAPFDLPEAENELIAGYHTEYSSMKFAVFFMGEYAAMFVFSMVFSAVFLGGYNLPLRLDVDAYNTINQYAAPLTFIFKSIVIFSAFIWIRATLPRLRYDQLMNLGWKSLLPLAAFNFVTVAIFLALRREDVSGQGNAWYGFASALVAAVILYAIYRAMNAQTRKISMTSRTIDMVDPAPRRNIDLVDPTEAPV